MDDAASRSVPHGPHVDLDLRMAGPVRATGEVMTTQERMRGLLHESQAIAAEQTGACGTVKKR